MCSSDLDAPGNEPVRRYLMEHARLVSAVRLPNNLFTEYAGTEVASDLIVLQKWSEKRELTPDEQRFVSSSEIGNGIYLNDYHRDFRGIILGFNPSAMLGIEFFLSTILQGIYMGII